MHGLFVLAQAVFCLYGFTIYTFKS